MSRRGPAELKEGDVSSFPKRIRGVRQTPSPVYLGGDPHRKGPRFPFDPPFRMEQRVDLSTAATTCGTTLSRKLVRRDRELPRVVHSECSPVHRNRCGYAHPLCISHSQRKNRAAAATQATIATTSAIRLTVPGHCPDHASCRLVIPAPIGVTSRSQRIDSGIRSPGVQTPAKNMLGKISRLPTMLAAFAVGTSPAINSPMLN